LFEDREGPAVRFTALKSDGACQTFSGLVERYGGWVAEAQGQIFVHPFGSSFYDDSTAVVFFVPFSFVSRHFIVIIIVAINF